MPEIERSEITIVDLENIASVLESLLTIVEARDLETAALRLSPPMPSALGIEAKRAYDRVTGLVKDYYYEREVETRDEQKEPDEPLPERPLGRPTVKRAKDPWDFHAQTTNKDEEFRRGSAVVREERGEA